MRIKTKILLLTISTLVSILLISTYYSRKAVEKSHEIALREDASKIARQVESYIPTDGRIRDSSELETHFDELLFLSSHIVRVDTHVFRPDGTLGPVISRSKFPTGLKPLGESDINSAKGGELLMDLTVEGGENFVNFVAPLRSGGAVFGITEFKISHEEFFSTMETKRKTMFLVAGISLIAVAGVLVLSMDRMVNEPIQNLLGAISRVKKGDLAVTVAPAASDEIGALTEHFNEMMSTIKKSADEKEALLSQINRHNDELQHRIDLATEELLKRNEALKRANQSIYEIQKKLGHSRRLAAVGQLAATVAHEFGTPLHSVSGHLQLLMEEPGLSTDITRRLTIMQSQIERITRSIQNLLDTTRPPDAYAHLDINRMMDDILLLVLPEITSRQITVSRDFQEGLPSVYGSSGRIQEVFLNIVDNAIDASRDGAVVRISTSLAMPGEKGVPSRVPSTGMWVRVQVTDSGRGIPKDIKERIFTPFYTTKAYGHGTGLGLAISQEIVESYNGHIMVESRVDEGSVFTVFFPAEHKKELA
jgi:two-component system NtrC family sensor kinase